MEIVRDELWTQCLDNAVKMYRLIEPDEKCFKLADATWRCKMSYKKLSDKKQERQTIVIDKPPEVINEPRNTKKLCCALTMSGKPCSFKAVCGDYCKKHNTNVAELGSKVDVTKIKITD